VCVCVCVCVCAVAIRYVLIMCRQAYSPLYIYTHVLPNIEGIGVVLVLSTV